jgi:type VI protein secretion system component VasK
MGLTETEATLSRVWEDLRHSDVQPVLASFPFNAEAETVVSPEMLEAVFRPQQGSFWQTFDPYLRPVCVEKGGIWRERMFPGGSLQLPENMLDTVNGIARLARTLWDEEGIPQPLSFSIKPMPLPSRYEHEPPVVLTYLKCGEGSVFGFNQQPSWETFQIEWWKESTATVGVVFAPKGKSGKESQIIGVPQSTWSFYRLLQKSELAESAVRTWRIENPQIKSKFLDVQFSIRGDPWDLFQIKGPA